MMRINNTQLNLRNKGKRTLSFVRSVLCFLISIHLIAHPLYPAFSYVQDEIESSIFNDLPHDVSSSDDIISNVCGSFTFANKFSFVRTVHDIVINSGEEISFNVLKKGFCAVDFDCTALNMPEGAAVKEGIFMWIPHESQTGTHTVTFVVTSKDGAQEILTVTLDILAALPFSDYDSNSDPKVENENAQDIKKEKTIDHLSEFKKSSHRKKRTESTGRRSHKTEECEDKEKTDPEEDETKTSSTGNSFTTSSTWFTAGGTTIYNTKGSSPSSSSSTTTSSTSQSSSSGGSSSSSQTSSSSSKKEGIQTQAQSVTPPAESAPDTPVLYDPGVSSFNGIFQIEWSDTAAFIYELQQARDEDFTIITNTFFPTDPFENLDETKQPESGYYYYRVRAWSALPENDGLSSDFSNTVVIGVDYQRDINIMSFPTIGIFTEVPGAPGTAVNWVVDGEAYSYPVMRLDYDLTQQFFAGTYFAHPVPIDISEMNTINIRLRGDEGVGYPIRMIIELKKEGVIQGIILVSDLTSMYQNLSFSFYSEANEIDEVIIFVEDDIDGDGVGALYVDEFFFSRLPFTPDIEPDIIENAGPALNDEEVLDKVEADTALYFYDEIVGPGHVKDTSETSYSSIAATGFGLSALAVLAERYGTSTFWQTVTPQMAEERASALLDDLLRIQQNQITDSAEYGVSGFFYHFMNADGTRAIGSEVSVVDTALLIVGALTAGEYFGGEVKEKADLLYASIDWTFFIDENTYRYRMGWRPESGRGFTTPKGGGYISSGAYNLPTDEVLLIALLALGNHFDDEMVRKSYFSYPREAKIYTAQSGEAAGTEYTVVNSFFGSLFTYLYAHCYFDFESLGVDKTYFAPEAPYPVSIDWWDNSCQAFKANRQFCIDQRNNFPFSYHENTWGISAVQRPDGRYEGRYGAVPFLNGPGNDGVVALYGPLSAMPFFRDSAYEEPSENAAYQSLRYYYNNYFTQMYGQYGFYDSFDNKGNFSTVYLGLDQGPIVLMIENYRSNLIWDTLSQNEKLSDVIDLVFADGFDFLDVEIFNTDPDDDTEPQEISFGFEGIGREIVPALQFITMSVNFSNPSGQFIVYTDNTNDSNTVRYTGSGDAGGLVGNQNTTQSAPLYWTVFDEVQLNEYTFTGDLLTEGKVQDKSNVDYNTPVMLDKRTIINGTGDLAPYPLAGRTTISSLIYIYFACDFSIPGLDEQHYSTETLTIEIFHE